MTATQSQTRILIADVHSLFREALKAVLDAESDLTVVAEASDGITAVAHVERTHPDIAIVDAQLTGCSGLQTTYLIKERAPHCKVLLLAEAQDEAELISAVEAGASGYFTKDTPLTMIIEGARAVSRGETVIPPRMLGALLEHLSSRRRETSDALRRLARLTSREKEVLLLLAQGADNAALAETLVISPQTARTHVQNILGKLGMHSRLEAASFVLRNDIAEDLVVGR